MKTFLDNGVSPEKKKLLIFCVKVLFGPHCNVTVILIWIAKHRIVI